MNEKIMSSHKNRKAILYIRQSTFQQVNQNEESRLLQYGMQDKIRSLGWTEVEIIDDDLGRSASGSVERKGFERMTAEVCLGKVGAVAARELSRFARNSKEWQQLVEVCRMVNTLLIDHEAIYDPRNSNDRLLLGLKGSLNEYELDLLRLRSQEARREKARRCELIVNPLPVGYVKGVDSLLVKDPDRRIQECLELIFARFMELGSARQVLMWFVENEVKIPSNRYGVNGWETIWRRPLYENIYGILQDPIYAGAYRYGMTETKLKYRNGSLVKSTRRKPIEEYTVLNFDNHEGYIDRDQFEKIRRMMSANNSKFQSPGAAKKGAALLSGLLRCSRCGRKLLVHYTGSKGTIVRYVCRRGNLDKGEPKCISTGGASLDIAISKEILKVVQPACIEAAVLASKKNSSHHEELLKALRLDLEAAEYAAERAWKQYDSADPSNRLVADELERRWENKLREAERLKTRIEVEQRPIDSSLQDLEELKKLAVNLEIVWDDPETDVKLKKRIIRTLIEEIVIDVNRDIGQLSVVVHWKGGVHTEFHLRSRRIGESSHHTSKDIVEAVRELTKICHDLIAGILNRNAFLTGRGNRWSQTAVISLRSKRKIQKYTPERKETEGWMNLTQAASHMGISSKSLRLAVEKGEIKGKHPLPKGPWIFKKDDLECQDAQRVISRVASKRKLQTETSTRQLSLFS